LRNEETQSEFLDSRQSPDDEGQNHAAQEQQDQKSSGERRNAERCIAGFEGGQSTAPAHVAKGDLRSAVQDRLGHDCVRAFLCIPAKRGNG
jgi:hypothetical protein